MKNKTHNYFIKFQDITCANQSVSGLKSPRSRQAQECNNSEPLSTSANKVTKLWQPVEEK